MGISERFPALQYYPSQSVITTFYRPGLAWNGSMYELRGAL